MTLWEYLRRTGYRSYWTGMAHLEIWVPAKNYHDARCDIEIVRSVGTHVAVMMEDLPS